MPNTQKTPRRGLEILLVDDDLTDIKLTLRELERNKIVEKVRIARDGVEAMQVLLPEGSPSHGRLPDLVFLDLNMPRKDGRQLLGEIKQHESLRSVPVIVLTTSDAQEDVSNSYLRHADGFITKPVTLEKVKKFVSHLPTVMSVLEDSEVASIL